MEERERLIGTLAPDARGVSVHCVVCGHVRVLRLPPNTAPQEFADQAGLSHALCLGCGKPQAHRAVLLPPGAYVCEAGCPHTSYEAARAYHQRRQTFQAYFDGGGTDWAVWIGDQYIVANRDERYWVYRRMDAHCWRDLTREQASEILPAFIPLDSQGEYYHMPQ